MDLDVASIITATAAGVAVIVRAWSTRSSARRKDLEDRVAVLEDQLLEWAGWAHSARLTAAGAGVRLPAIPQPRSSSDTTEREGAS